MSLNVLIKDVLIKKKVYCRRPLMYFIFLDASSYIYKRLCLSVGQSIGWSIGRSIRRSVGSSVTCHAFVKTSILYCTTPKFVSGDFKNLTKITKKSFLRNSFIRKLFNKSIVGLLLFSFFLHFCSFFLLIFQACCIRLNLK